MFRFTIRDLLWLTVVVALLAAWWLDRNSLRRESALQLRAAEAERKKAQLELYEVNIQNLRNRQDAERLKRESRDRAAWEAVKAKSEELGAPLSKPLPN
jgi:hypothetical protein